ncbi:Dynamin_N domain-containing protein [Azospirillaceae bacterium]
MTPKKALLHRLETLENHLRSEHPSLLAVLPTFRAFDKLLYRMGFLDQTDSLALRIPWWPMVAILGLFSAGKSSFINSYLGADLQISGNQAVDDKFTMICFGPDRKYDALPGTALNADPRFPFYRMSDEIEKVAKGEGKRIDAYLQLKTCSSTRVKGKIIIDSPGFDADDQRRSTLRVTDHILDLADLVLIFFDARRPEPGAMQDTLSHLVSKTVQRSDTRKFLYVLNQIDTSAREDNPEAVVGAWQRAIASAGLISGRFYGIYNRDVAPPIDDPIKRARYESKCSEDLAEIHARINEVEYGRGYRIVGILDGLAKELDGEIIPYLVKKISLWRRWVILCDALILIVMAALIGEAFDHFGYGTIVTWMHESRPAWFWNLPARAFAVGAGALLIFSLAHFQARQLVAQCMVRRLPERIGQLDLNLRLAFLTNTRSWRSLFWKTPTGWGKMAERRIFAIREAVARHVQAWNDLYTDPAGYRYEASAPGSPTLAENSPFQRSASEEAAAVAAATAAATTILASAEEPVGIWAKSKQSLKLFVQKQMNSAHKE